MVDLTPEEEQAKTRRQMQEEHAKTRRHITTLQASLNRKTSANVAALKADVDKFVAEYNKAAADSAQTAQATAVAQVFPGVANGMVTIIHAAGQTPQDAMMISAGVMDILGSIGSAAPPPFGAALGALFSLVSIFLKAFAPKAPSLLEQMETLLRKLQGEEAKHKIRAAGEAVAVYANAAELFMTACDKTCAGKDIEDPALLQKHNQKLNLIEGNAITAIR